MEEKRFLFEGKIQTTLLVSCVVFGVDWRPRIPGNFSSTVYLQYLGISIYIQHDSGYEISVDVIK